MIFWHDVCLYNRHRINKGEKESIIFPVTGEDDTEDPYHEVDMKHLKMYISSQV